MKIEIKETDRTIEKYRLNRDNVFKFNLNGGEPHYKVLLLDIPFKDCGYWIDCDIVKEFYFLELYMGIFEEIFEDLLKKFDDFSFYDISNFSGDSLLKLLEALENENKENLTLTHDKFISKYEYVYSYTKDVEDGALFTKDELKDSILLIFETFILFTKKAIDEHKCITVVGI